MHQKGVRRAIGLTSRNQHKQDRGKNAPERSQKSHRNSYDRSSIANSKKLQSLRPPQYWEKRGTAITTTVPVLLKERFCNYCNRSSIAEKESVVVATLAVLHKETNWNY